MAANFGATLGGGAGFLTYLFLDRMTVMVTDPAKIQEVLTRGVERIYPSREAFEKKLMSGERLRIYLGIDPTSSHLHIGHLPPLLALRRFQELGHEIILLVGDFTAQIGDPSDKLSARQPLTVRQVRENLKTFKRQASKVLKIGGMRGAKMKFNSEWLSGMKVADFIGLTQHITVQQLIQRDMFQERLKSDKPIGLHEFLYPLMQGYDSVAMGVDVEIGGNDQTFNMLIGRDLMKAYVNKEKFVLVCRLLVNPVTGKKLSKTEGALVNLDDAPNDMFAKAMAIDDAMSLPLAELSTLMPMAGIEKLGEDLKTNVLSPRDAKLAVAHALVSMMYDIKAGDEAKAEFIRVFSEGLAPTEVLTHKVGKENAALIDLLVDTKLAESKSEARRLIEQGGVSIDEEKKSDPNETIAVSGQTLRVGKHRFIKIIS